MASSKGTKLTRRQLIVSLAAAASVRPAAAKAEAGTTMTETCSLVTPSVGRNPGNVDPMAKVIWGDPCCGDGVKAFVGGTAALEVSDKPAHGRLSAFSKEVLKAREANQLMEYSIFIWGLTDAQRTRLVDQLKEAYPPPSSEK